MLTRLFHIQAMFFLTLLSATSCSERKTVTGSTKKAEEQLPSLEVTFGKTMQLNLDPGSPIEPVGLKAKDSRGGDAQVLETKNTCSDRIRYSNESMAVEGAAPDSGKTCEATFVATAHGMTSLEVVSVTLVSKVLNATKPTPSSPDPRNNLVNKIITPTPITTPPITQSPFTGLISASAVVGGHIKLNWTPDTSPNTDRYLVYLSTVEGVHDLSSPIETVMGASSNTINIGGLPDGVTYYAIVQASNGTSSDGNANSLSVTTLTRPSAPGPFTSYATAQNQISAYCGFSSNLIAKGEISTFAGLTVPNCSGVQTRDSIVFKSPYGAVVAPDGSLIFSATSHTRIYRIDTFGNVTTFAGTGVGGWSGDGGPATLAQIGSPYQLTLSSTGEVIFADYSINVVRKIDSAGIITTLAGNGSPSVTGDGGYATNAAIGRPVGVAADSFGNIYISDFSNNRIRKVDSSGIISHYAGTGVNNYTGDGGMATAAALRPYGLTIGPNGDLYVAAYFHNRIRRISSNGKIYRVAGTGTTGGTGDEGPATSATLNRPSFITFDSVGNLFISEYVGHRVRKVDTNGTISLVAGTGSKTIDFNTDGISATTTSVSDPGQVAIDSAGQVYIPSYQQHLFRVLRSDGSLPIFSGQYVSGFTGDGGPATAARLEGPVGFVRDAAGNSFISEHTSGRIRKIDTHGIITVYAGTGTSGPATDGVHATSSNLNSPYFLSMDKSGSLVFPDSVNHQIRKIETNGVITTLVGTGTGGYAGDGNPATAALINDAKHAVFDSAGNMYFSDRGNYRIRKVDTKGIISTIAGLGTSAISGENIPATSATLSDPFGLAFDKNGNLYFAEYKSHQIRKIAVDGNISTFAGTGTGANSGDGGPASSAGIANPVYLVFGPDDSLYVSTSLSPGRVRRIDSNGIIQTVAGNGVPGFDGDGGQSTSAQLSRPFQIHIDSEGNMWVADYETHRVRYIRMK